MAAAVVMVAVLAVATTDDLEAQPRPPETFDPANGMLAPPPGYIGRVITGDGAQDLETFIRENQLTPNETAAVRPVFLRAHRQTWVNEATQRIIVSLVIVVRGPAEAKATLGPLTTEPPPGATFLLGPQPVPGVAECLETRIRFGEDGIGAAAMTRGPLMGFAYVIQAGGPAPEDEFRSVMMAQVAALDRLSNQPVIEAPTATALAAPADDGGGGMPWWFVPVVVMALLLALVAIMLTTRRQRAATAGPSLSPFAPDASLPLSPGPGIPAPGAQAPREMWAPSATGGVPPHPRSGGPPAPAPPPPPPGAVPAAWQPDPTGRHQLRFWDGSKWTPHVSDNSVTSQDLV